MKLLLGDDDGDLWTVGYLFVGGDINCGNINGAATCSEGELKRLFAILIFGKFVGLSSWFSSSIRRILSSLSPALFLLEGGGKVILLISIG